MKVRIKSIPENKNEFDIQNKTNNTLHYKTEKTEPSIGQTYPEEDEDNGNVIAEKGEMILTKEGVFKIPGKSHKKGGTEITMGDGDFIFSNYLTITGDILKTEFNLNPKKEYTFAEVASKYKDLNKFNSKNKDNSPIVQKTNELMTGKYKEKLVRLALLQEQQKGFPTGIPAVAEESLESPEMKKGGLKPNYKTGGGPDKVKAYQGDKTNKSNASKTSTQQWQELAKTLGFQGNSNKEFQEFLYNQDNEYAKLIDDIHAKNPTLSKEKFDDMLGARWDPIYEGINKILATTPTNTPVGTTPTITSNESSTFTQVKPNELGETKSSSYRDMGASSAEKLALFHAMQVIPSFEPTRQQNYGLEQAQGIMSNLMPYDYTSMKNDASRAAQAGIKFNRGFNATPQAMANNAFITGQLASQTSNIEGQEYNANANLYNTGMKDIANIVTMSGADREQQGDLYNTRVSQTNENRWANRAMRDKQFVQEYSNMKNQRSLRNAYAFLGESVTPNFNIMNADGAVAFNAMQNPFEYFNTFDKQLPNNKKIAVSFKEFKKQFDGTDLTDDKIADLYLKTIK